MFARESKIRKNKVFKEEFGVRRKTRKLVDRRIFRRTASKSKKINISPNVYRGGIRL